MTRWSWGQWSLRAVLLTTPSAALLVAAPGTAVPGSLLAAVLVASGWWALRPEASGGVAALVLVLGWWAWTVPDLPARSLVAAALLTAAHVAALVLGYGPDDLAPDPGTCRLWARRVLLLGATAAPAWGVGRVLLPVGPPPAWVWPAAAVAVAGLALTAIGAALAERRTA